MNKKNSREHLTAAKELKQPDCNTEKTTRQAIELIDFAAALFRCHTALLKTAEVGLKTLGNVDCAEWQSAIRNFETAERELDSAWEVVKAQGYTSRARAYNAYVKICVH